MDVIQRQPVEAAEKAYDLIIIGGGIYGVMLSLEASRRNSRSLLLEKGDFGAETSFNALRLLHGGLRSLKRLNFAGFMDFARDQRWFIRTFPGLVRPLPVIRESVQLFNDLIFRRTDL